MSVKLNGPTTRVYTPAIRPGKDITGKQFGRLTAVHLIGSYKKAHYWLCRCSCGKSVEVASGSLRSGNTMSCGCLISEGVISRSTTHGKSKTAIYGMWRRMIQRCEDENCTDYKYYGARGITVCDAWHNFETFIKDVGDRPKGMTLDRVRNNEGYGPDNFRWATHHEQMNNTRSNVKTLLDGKLLSIKEMAEISNITYETMKARLTRLGYTAEQALFKPVKCGQTLEMAHAELTET